MKEYIVETDTQEQTAKVALKLLKDNGLYYDSKDILHWKYVIKSEVIKANDSAEFLNDTIPGVVNDLFVITFSYWENNLSN